MSREERRRWLMFIMGIVVGLLLAVVFAVSVSNANANSDKPGDVVITVGGWTVRKVFDGCRTLYYTNDGNIAVDGSGCK